MPPVVRIKSKARTERRQGLQQMGGASPDCGSITSADACKNDCSWNSISGKCRVRSSSSCSAYTSETPCGQDESCYWVAGPPSGCAADMNIKTYGFPSKELSAAEQAVLKGSDSGASLSPAKLKCYGTLTRQKILPISNSDGTYGAEAVKYTKAQAIEICKNVVNLDDLTQYWGNKSGNTTKLNPIDFNNKIVKCARTPDVGLQTGNPKIFEPDPNVGALNPATDTYVTGAFMDNTVPISYEKEYKYCNCLEGYNKECSGATANPRNCVVKNSSDASQKALLNDAYRSLKCNCEYLKKYAKMGSGTSAIDTMCGKFTDSLRDCFNAIPEGGTDATLYNEMKKCFVKASPNLITDKSMTIATYADTNLNKYGDNLVTGVKDKNSATTTSATCIQLQYPRNLPSTADRSINNYGIYFNLKCDQNNQDVVREYDPAVDIGRKQMIFSSATGTPAPSETPAASGTPAASETPAASATTDTTCSPITTSQNCASNVDCVWDATNNKCAVSSSEKCGMYKGMAPCSNDANCSWNSTTNLCDPAASSTTTILIIVAVVLVIILLIVIGFVMYKRRRSSTVSI